MEGAELKTRVVTRAKLEKRDAAGEVFETIEIEDDGRGKVQATVTYRRPGEPPSSYAALPISAPADKG
jgi:hypothetical protein